MPVNTGPVSKIMTWKRALLAVLAASAVFGTVFAFATSLTVHGAGLATGADGVGACDSNGFTYSFAFNNDEVTQVTIGDIAAACTSGHLSITLTDASNVAVGSGSDTVPSSSEMTVSIPQNPTTWSVVHEYVSIVGP